jgi:hypothetical protein
MKSYTRKTARHCNCSSLYEIDQNREKIAVFDDEETDCLSLYLTDGTKFFPARTIYLGDLSRAWNILTAWSLSRPFVDLRNNQSIPLP